MSLDMTIDLPKSIKLGEITAAAQRALRELLPVVPPGEITITRSAHGKERPAPDQIGLPGQIVFLDLTLSGGEGKVFITTGDMTEYYSGGPTEDRSCPRHCMVSISGDGAEGLVLGAAAAIAIARVAGGMVKNAGVFPGVQGDSQGDVWPEEFLKQVRLAGEYPDFATAAKAFHAKVWSEWRRRREGQAK